MLQKLLEAHLTGETWILVSSLERRGHLRIVWPVIWASWGLCILERLFEANLAGKIGICGPSLYRRG